MSQIYPEFLSLLDNKKNLKSGSNLFGPKFVVQLVSEAQAQSTLRYIQGRGTLPMAHQQQAATVNLADSTSTNAPTSQFQPGNPSQRCDLTSLAFPLSFGGQISRFINA